jgi:Late embryogenesis abundant (LEA) group 1
LYKYNYVIIFIFICVISDINTYCHSGKAEQATARTHGQKEAAKEREKAREAEAKAELHGKKAEHREEAGAHHGIGHVPLTGPHHHHPVGSGATNPNYPTTGTRPASEKYF